MRFKGRIRQGVDTDIMVFDVSNIKVNATFTAPAQPSIRMRYVLVNGNSVINNGVLDVNTRSSLAIRRSMIQ